MIDTSGKFDIIIHAGADLELTLTIRDEDGNLYDLTGCTATAQLREYPEAVDKYDFTVTHNNDGGQILMKMSHDLTAKIPFTSGHYDLFIDTTVEVIKLMYGEAEIIPAGTR